MRSDTKVRKGDVREQSITMAAVKQEISAFRGAKPGDAKKMLDGDEEEKPRQQEGNAKAAVNQAARTITIGDIAKNVFGGLMAKSEKEKEAE